MDVIPGGDPHPLAFTADVCSEWLSDRIDIRGPVASKVFEAFVAYQDQLKNEKKS
jgi:hypothetical protein